MNTFIPMRSHFYRIFLFTFLVLFLFNFSLSCSPSLATQNSSLLKGGVLDLSTYNWDSEGIIRLDGEWNFFWNKFVTEENYTNLSLIPDSFIIVPGEWNHFFKNNSNPKGFGYGTYVLHVKGNKSSDLVLKFLLNSTASEVEYNKKIVYKSGNLHTSPDSHIPQSKPAFIYLDDTPEDFLLLIRVSNFTTSSGGLTSVLRLGTPSQMIQYTESNHLRDFFTLGSLLIIGMYHAFIFLGRRSEKTSLFFGLFCLVTALRTFLGGDITLFDKDSIATYLIFLRMEYFTLPFATYLSQSYLFELIGDSIKKNIENQSLPLKKNYKLFTLSNLYTLKNYILALSLLLSIGDLLLSPHTFTNNLILSHINFFINSIYAISFLSYLYKKKEEYVGSILLSIGIFVLLILNDVLNRYYIINTIQLFQIGFIFFIFSQSYIITSKQANKFAKTENQKLLSEVIARELEAQVNSRTEDLKKESLKVMFQKTEIENMNLLIKSLNEDLMIEEIVKKIQGYVSFRFNINNILLARIEKNSNTLKPVILNLPDLPNPENINLLKNSVIQIKENSIHSGAIRYKKVFWQRRIKKPSISAEENHFLEYLKCKSIVYIPLFLNKEPIAFLYLFLYNSFKIGKNDMHHIRVIGEQIGSSIYNAWLLEETNKNKDIIESALRNLKESQHILVQAEKMTAMGQLVAGIAHEINTPIGAIKASAKNINDSIDHIISFSNQLTRELEIDTMNLISDFLVDTDSTPIVIPTKEERSNKKNIYKSLSKHNIAQIDEVTDTLTMLKFTDVNEKYLPLWNHKKVLQILKLINELGGIRHKAKMIDLSVDKTSKIIYALRAYTMRDLNGRPISASIASGIETVLLIYENNIKQGIELTLNIQNDLPEILCYPDELNQVWTNILHNAIQATSGKGKLIISIQQIEKLDIPGQDKPGICVSIADNGPGIPPEFQQKIFEPFFTTKKAGEGTGLGLHICREIIKKHGGDIFIESRPGFTQFSIQIPLEIEFQD
jgi:signal transduction histidine kinase